MVSLLQDRWAPCLSLTTSRWRGKGMANWQPWASAHVLLKAWYGDLLGWDLVRFFKWLIGKRDTIRICWFWRITGVMEQESRLPKRLAWLCQNNDSLCWLLPLTTHRRFLHSPLFRILIQRLFDRCFGWKLWRCHSHSVLGVAAIETDFAYRWCSWRFPGRIC